MRVTLAAIADDGDLLALDQIEIGIPIVIDAHNRSPALITALQTAFGGVCDALNGKRQVSAA
jgi:hypothetical protein